MILHLWYLMIYRTSQKKLCFIIYKQHTSWIQSYADALYILPYELTYAGLRKCIIRRQYFVIKIIFLTNFNLIYGADRTQLSLVSWCCCTSRTIQINKTELEIWFYNNMATSIVWCHVFLKRQLLDDKTEWLRNSYG